MTDADKTVFLCYRRLVSWQMARLVRDNLESHGFNVFLDVAAVGGGEFERVLLREIATRTYFLVLLEPRSLDRITELGDWLRREIAHALGHGCNIVPILVNGATMPRAEDLPADIARLQSYNALTVSHEYFDAAMQKLREHFLRPAPRPERIEPSPSRPPPAASDIGSASPNTVAPRHDPVAPSAYFPGSEEPAQATGPGPPLDGPSELAVRPAAWSSDDTSRAADQVSRNHGGMAARRPATQPPTRRLPAHPDGPRRSDPLDRALDGVNRSTVHAGGGRRRGLGRLWEVDPIHRRGGLGVLVLVLAVFSGAAMWADSGGPVGRWLATAAEAVTGLGAEVLPVLLVIVGIVLVTTEGRPESRPRLVVGSALLALGVLGLVHLGAGLPVEPRDWSKGGGVLGYLASIPLATGLTVWVAAPVLIVLTCYAFLLLIDTPLREVPNLARRLAGRGVQEDAALEDDDLADEPDLGEPPVEPARRRPSRRRQAGFAEPPPDDTVAS